MKFSRVITIFLTIVILTGCKTELYSGLAEREGNQMLAILLAEGISAEKSITKEGVMLQVDSSQVVHALEALKRQGYPKESFSSVKDLFPDEGLISSPTQERARYIFAKSQEIASTLSQIDGVITARVHVVMPEIERGSSRQKKNLSSNGVCFYQALT
jgi:type III secretion protein J